MKNDSEMKYTIRTTERYEYRDVAYGAIRLTTFARGTLNSTDTAITGTASATESG